MAFKPLARTAAALLSRSLLMAVRAESRACTRSRKLVACLQAVTYDASEAAGCVPGCVNNTRTTFSLIRRACRTAAGRRNLQQALGLCDELPPGCEEDVSYWVQASFPRS